MQRQQLAVIIVHYRTPELLRDCLESLQPQLQADTDAVVVVDNASDDGSLPALRALPGIRLIASPQNLGFAGANNLGIAACDAEYYMLLNPDTVLRPRALELLLGFLDAHPAAAMVGPRLEGLDATPQLSAFGEVTPLSELVRGANLGLLTRLLTRHEVYGEYREATSPAAWLAGACLLIRRAVFEKIGLLDPGYFMYYEEVDFCRRARLAGLQAWYYPEPRVVHLVGQSSGVTSQRAARRLPPYWFASRHRYFRKHFGYCGAIAADGLWLLGHTLNRIRRLCTGVSYSCCAQRETRDFIAHEARQLLSLRQARSA